MTKHVKNCRPFKSFLFLLMLLISVTALKAQQTDRLFNIRYRLSSLALEIRGLNQRIEMDVVDAPIADFMRGLALSYKLSINIAPDVRQKMTNHFSNVTVQDVLYFLAQQYNLDYDFHGAILNVRTYRDPQLDLPPPPKPINVSFDSKTRMLTVDLQNDTLQQVARKISQLTEINIVVMPNAVNKLISGFVNSQSIPNALEQLSVSNRLKFTRSDDHSFIMEALADDEEIVTRQSRPLNESYTIARKITRDKTAPGRVSVDAKTVGDERLLNVSAVNTPLADLIRNISEQSGVAYFIYADLKGNVTAEARNLSYPAVLQKVLVGTPYSFSRQDGVYMIGEKTFEGIKGQRLIQLQHRSVDSLGYFLPDDMRKDVVLKEFKELNAFLVTGSEPQMDKIETLVKQIDRKVPMVTIEVIIMDVTKGRTTKAGLRAGVNYDSLPAFGGRLLGGGVDFTIGSGSINRFIDKIGLNNVFNLGHVTPNFYVNLQAIENLENVEMRQTPKLSTLNGHMATLSIGSTRYYRVETSNAMGSLSPTLITTQQFYPVEANLTLNITPFVSADEDVTLKMEMDISNFIGEMDIRQPPPTATSKFNSIIRVKNDDMILLGGIERTEKGETSQGVPLLGRIPVLKWLFSSRTKKNSKVVSIVFIKPTIVYN